MLIGGVKEQQKRAKMAEILSVSSSSQMVNIQAGAELKLVEFVSECISLSGEDKLSEAEAFAKGCADLVGDADAPGLIRKLLDQRDLILTRDSNSDIEGCFQLLCNLLFKVEDPSLVPVLSEEIAVAVLDPEKASEKASMKLKVITNLYNLLPTGCSSQQVILLNLIKFAAASNQLKLLRPYFNDIDRWVTGLKMDISRQRELYLLIADCLATIGDSHESQQFLLKLLRSYNNLTEGDKVDLASAEIVKVAARCAVQAVRFPLRCFTQGHGLLRLDAIQQLEKQKEYKPLYELLCIFSAEKLDVFEEFIGKNPKILEKYELDTEQCTSNMRLLSLSSLATEHEEIPYSVISETLKIEAEAVEEWVVRAINADLLEAKMDQINQVVMIARCSQRQFGTKQWIELGEKLNAWKQNVQGLMLTIRKSQDMFSSHGAPP
mmetsp:Transcript_37003/g.48721  ORF Transcript_37003/g.48721 Transcript_37003/m.48721 type:complete len:435 (+) Transcript_37003:31-1335(+)